MMQQDAFTVIKTGTAEKRGRAGGVIHYEVGHAPSDMGLQIRITENPSSSGKFSKKWNRVRELTEKIQDVAGDDGCFQTKTIKEAIIGKSANDPGFIVAALRAEGLLVPCPTNPGRPMLSEELTVKQWTESLIGKGTGKSKRASTGTGRQRRKISLEGKEADVSQILKDSDHGDVSGDAGDGR